MKWINIKLETEPGKKRKYEEKKQFVFSDKVLQMKKEKKN